VAGIDGGEMRIARINVALVLALFCICLRAQAQSQRLTVTGKLTRVMAIGGETTGWAIQVESEITIDSKQVNSIDVYYSNIQKLEKLENMRVKATGRLSHRHGVETGDRLVLDASSIKQSTPK
jgi:hypothetical protein